jgi:multidrug efflux pump subunit AcrB
VQTIDPITRRAQLHPIRTRADGTTIFLKDVAKVRDRFSESPNATYFNNERAVNMTVTSTNAEGPACGRKGEVRTILSTINDSQTYSLM